MIVVREVFIAKPGQASKLAKMFKDEIAQWETGKRAKVMTDMTGVFNKVVIEMEYDDLAAFDKEMQEYMKQTPAKPDPSKPTHIDMYAQGKREIFRVW
jgi:hypothetical protein